MEKCEWNLYVVNNSIHKRRLYINAWRSKPSHCQSEEETGCSPVHLSVAITGEGEMHRCLGKVRGDTQEDNREEEEGNQTHDKQE